ncbi:MAG: two-component system cell cycle sensor histidine kinase PleC, partial [Maricaulis maris]
MNQMRFDHRPSKAPAAKDRTPQSPSRGSKGRDRNLPTDKPAKKRGSGVSWIILAMVLFTLAYGGILLVKIQQEREILITEAERSQANAAGY